MTEPAYGAHQPAKSTNWAANGADKAANDADNASDGMDKAANDADPPQPWRRTSHIAGTEHHPRPLVKDPV
jgi:hypothetical protein